MPKATTQSQLRERANSLTNPELYAPASVECDPTRRDRCKYDLRAYLETYKASAFNKPFGDDHLRAIHRLERSLLYGEQYALAMPRGGGKTTVGEGGVQWAWLYGHRHFLVILGSALPKAINILDAIVGDFEDNELLQADFPESVLPFAELEGKTARTRYQTCWGVRTQISRKRDKIECPRIPGGVSVESIIATMGLQGGDVRGPRKKMPDGSYARPDFVFPDDPQTEESAHSQSQTDQREKLIDGAVLGMAGPGVRIAALATVTVIEQNDLADRMLNRELHPEWQGERYSMITAWPKNMELWNEYAKLWREGLEEDSNTENAIEFYRRNKEKMDEGAAVSWEARKNDDEISALQHAMTLYYKLGEEVFFSEYQNLPKTQATKAYELDAETVAKQVNGRKARIAPDNTQFVCGFTDINHYGLHWAIVAAQQDMTGAIVEYGKYPAHGELVPKNTSESEISKAVYEGCQALMKMMVDFHIDNVDRNALHMFLIDAGYQMDTVFRVVANTKTPFITLPSRGRPAKYYKQKRVIGQARRECHVTRYEGKGRILEHNADFWRMACQKAFLPSPGSPGSLSLYGNNPKQHAEFAQHITAEYLVEHLRGDAADYYNWAHIPGSKWDWLDATVGAWMGCNYLGSSFGAVAPRKKKPARRRPKRNRENAV